MGLPLFVVAPAMADSFPTNVAFLGTQSATNSTAADFPDTIGFNAIQTLTTNLNGSGICVGQAEASAPPFEVNPAAVGQPTSLFTWFSSGLSTNGFPNQLGVESSHSDNVANVFYGLPFGVATNVAHVINFDARSFVSYYVVPGVPTAAQVVNQSFTYGAYITYVDQAFDNYADQFGVLLISGAGFNGQPVYSPGTCYNGISVGVYNNPGSPYGPTPDGRSKPDITAWGNQDSVTSYSTPLVAGAATLLLQAGYRGDGGADTNAAVNLRTLKALLLNGAIKPLGWTNSPAAPLHTVYGAGVLNLVNSYEQLTGGKHGFAANSLVVPGANHPPAGSVPAWSQANTNAGPLRGWDLNTIASSGTADAVNHYYFDVTNAAPGAAFTATATLVWNRQYGQGGINNLGVYLYNIANGQLINCSTSLVDNVQHIYIPSLPAGAYDLQVWKSGAAGVSDAETYALAYEFFSQSSSVTTVGTNTVISWPVYPAGFAVEAATNYASPTWVTLTNDTPVIVAGAYQLTVPAYNPGAITWVTVTNVVDTNGFSIGPAPIGPGGTTNVESVPTYHNNMDLHYFRLRRPNL